MKKISFCLGFLSISLLSVAQIKRTPTIKTDSLGLVTNPAMEAKKEGGAQMQMFKELDLTKEQRGKLKEMRQTNKAKKEAIDGDTTLSEADKRQKLKALRKEQQQGTMSILTDEQKAKLKKKRQEKGDDEMLLKDN